MGSASTATSCRKVSPERSILSLTYGGCDRAVWTEPTELTVFPAGFRLTTPLSGKIHAFRSLSVYKTLPMGGAGRR